MNRLLLLLLLSTASIGYSQKDVITYVTPQKDTLYVIEDMYDLMASIWDNPITDEDKPVIVSVESLDKFIARKEDEDGNQ